MIKKCPKYLEKDGFAMFAFGTWVFLWSWKCGISNDIRNNIGQFVNFVHNFVHYCGIHDMFSRTFQIRIYKFFHQYFSVEKEKKILICQKRHSLSVLTIWENINKYFMIFGRKNCRFVFGKIRENMSWAWPWIWNTVEKWCRTGSWALFIRTSAIPCTASNWFLITLAWS